MPGHPMDLYNEVRITNALLPATTGSASRDGVDVDMQGFCGALFTVNVGAPGDTLSGTVKFDFTLQHADDNGSGAPDTYADCTSDEVNGKTIASGGIWQTVDANGEASQSYSVGYKGNKRWLRVQVEKTGTHSNGTPIGATVARCPIEHPPASVQ